MGLLQKLISSWRGGVDVEVEDCLQFADDMVDMEGALGAELEGLEECVDSGTGSVQTDSNGVSADDESIAVDVVNLMDSQRTQNGPRDCDELVIELSSQEVVEDAEQCSESTLHRNWAGGTSTLCFWRLGQCDKAN
ncbi:hypothetical protein ElyMa_001642800 [Elysia marginata]|uniref:Uncharacterized protein n=1 Tax=Elysia marginata TaxID=1093978 RepID=A0AAV4JPW6_9GAST|nr:hypothetical protein ElyMa_001642800 [Elysia marginata]